VDIDGNGIYANNTDSLKIYHNLIGNVSENIVYAVVNTDRSQNGRKLAAENNHVANNIFINGKPSLKTASTISDFNLFVTTKQLNYFTPEALLKSGEGEGKNSQPVYTSCEFTSENLSFQWETKDLMPFFPFLSELKRDFYDKMRTEKNAFAGLFTEGG
jgi:alpha-L-arabinofuranosidase